MTRPGIRLVLVLLLLAAIGGAGYVAWSGERALEAAAVSMRDRVGHADRALATIGDLRAGHQAYVATGQSLSWWQERVASGIEGTRTALSELRRGADEAGVLDDVDAAVASLDEFVQIDRRAANLVLDNETKQASRLVFGEGTAALASIAERVASVRLAVGQAFDAQRDEQRRREAMVTAGCAALAVVIALLLLPLGTRTEARSEQAPPLATPRVVRVEPSVAPVVPEEPVAAVEVSRPAPAAATSEGAADDLHGRDRRKSPELRAAADLCTDFARLRDAQELPALLERAARLLDASGLIVWIADPLGNKLTPTFAHGYPAHALTRLPAIARTADNATAAAFRHAQIEIVKTNGMSPGAIVVPLLTPDGCIGVIAAEVRHGREASETSRAVARILAAQMSTLLGTPTAQDHTQHAVG